jgi:exonuclease III
MHRLIKDGGNRVLALIINTEPRNTLVINVYMPAKESKKTKTNIRRYWMRYIQSGEPV